MRGDAFLKLGITPVFGKVVRHSALATKLSRRVWEEKTKMLALKKHGKSLAEEALASEKGSVVPYVFAWFLGVPSSLLFLIFILRGCN
jgi:hypothetical protein